MYKVKWLDDEVVDYQIFEDYDGELQELFNDTDEDEIEVMCSITDEIFFVNRDMINSIQSNKN